MIRGRKRDLREVKNVTMEASIHNRFDVEVVDSATGEVKRRAEAENVICDQLWSRLLTPNDYFNFIHYGTGAGAPSSTDTSLFTFSGYLDLYTDYDVSDYSRAGHWYSLRRKGQLAENVAVGQTLTEVGIAYGTGSSTLCTHAMLQDMNGNQISIQKTDTDVINIYATVFVHWPDSLVSGGVQLSMHNSTSAGFLTYLAGRHSVNGHADLSAMPPNYAMLTTKRGLIDYSNSEDGSASKQYGITHEFNIAARTITSTVSRIPVGVGNWKCGARGVVAYIKGPGYTYMVPVFYFEAGKGDWFIGSIIQGEAIGTGDGNTVDFATAFDDPESATVYVDGVAVSDVVVDKAPVNIGSMARFFDAIDIENGITYPGMNENYVLSSGHCNDGIYFNPYWEYGIDSFYANSILSVCVSDDLISWEYIVGSDGSTKLIIGSKSVPKELQFKKYWNVEAGNYNNRYIYDLTSPTLTGKNIHFATPPAAGAVITADYFTKRIAKDSNHVFDLTLTIQLGERTM